MKSNSHISLKDERFTLIKDFLDQFTHGNLNQKLQPSKKSDELDAIMVGLNMILEEIKIRYVTETNIEMRINEVLSLLLSFAQQDFSPRIKVINDNSSFEGLATGVNILGEQLEEFRDKIVESELSKSSLISNIPGVVYRCRQDPQWTLEFMSEECESLTGYGSSEMMGTGFAAIVHPDDLARIGAEVEEAMTVKSSFELEYRIKTKNGIVKHVWEKGNPVLCKQGEIVAIEGLIIDVTDKKKSEDKLLLANNQLQQLIDNSPAVIYTSKASGDFQATFISDNIKEQFGYEAKEFVDEQELWAENIHPDDQKKVYKELEQLFEVSDNHSLEYRFKHKNGNYVWVHDDYRLERDAHGNPKYIVGLWINITKRKEAELHENVINNISRRLSENLSTTKFLEFIRQELSDVFPTDNFYVSLFDSDTSELTRIYDVRDNKAIEGLPRSRIGGNGLSEYVIEKKKPLLLLGDKMGDFQKKRGMNMYGRKSKSWLGVPLIEGKRAIGIIAVESSTSSSAFSEKDMELFAFVGTQIGSFIQKNEAQKLLLESEEKFRSIFENSQDVIGLIDNKAKILNLNRAFGGHNLDDTIGTSLYSWPHRPEELALCKKMVKQVFKECEPRSYNITVPDAKGELTWHSITVSPILIAGQVKSASIVSRDITKQRRAMEELQENQLKLQSFFELAPVGIALNNMQGEFIEVNPEFSKFTGYTIDELNQLSYWDLTPEEYSDQEKVQLKSLAESSKYGPYEKEYIHREGFRYPVLLSGAIVKDSKGEEFIWSIVQDITERKKVEEEIREYEKYFSLSMDLMCIMDQHGFFRKINPMFTKNLGYAIEELISVPFVNFVHPEDIKVTIKETKRLSEGIPTIDFINRYRCKDGIYKWYHWTGASETGSGLLYATAREITEKIEKERALEISENKYRSLFERMIGGLMLSNENGTIEMVNPQIVEMLGYQEEELIGNNVYELLTDKKERTRIKNKVALRKQGMSETYETKFIHKSGKQLWVQISASPIYSSKGSFDGIMAVIMDITKRKEAEELEKSFFNVLNQSQNEIYISDATNSKFMYVNQGARENLGYTMDEMKKLTPYDIKENFKLTDFKRLISPLVQGTKTKVIFEAVHKRKNGTSYPVELNVQLTTFMGQDVFMTVVSDITARKEAERLKEAFTQELEQKVEERTSALENTKKVLELSLEKEKELGELKSRFVSIASHQFRTPMTVIQSNSELIGMLMENSPPNVKNKLGKATGKIFHEIKVMTSLMDEILILGKITSGSKVVDLQPTDMLAFCSELIEKFGVIQQDGRTVDFEFAGEQQDVDIDLKLASHVIGNLLSNAFKYSEGKNPKMKLVYGKKELKILISDFGIGIPAKDLDNLFQPFHRATNVNDIEGTGLGLAIAKEYLELNNGKIQVESKLNKGSTFTVILPISNNLQSIEV